MINLLYFSIMQFCYSNPNVLALGQLNLLLWLGTALFNSVCQPN